MKRVLQVVTYMGCAGLETMLGHRDPTSVMKYLLLDDERSRKCGLSLSATGLMLEGGL